MLGITPGITFDMPFTVKIDTHDVGGPSAGTMFALGVYDTLTPGSLTGGKRIAGTGTIDPETGDVGEIGGIAQKMVGAKNARRAMVPRSGQQLRRRARPRAERAARGQDLDAAPGPARRPGHRRRQGRLARRLRLRPAS